MAPFTIIRLLGGRKIKKHPKKEAEYATRNGAIVACIIVAAGTAFSLFGILPGAGEEWGTYAGPGNFLDLLVLFACALGMFRKSRVACVAAFTYYFVGRVILLTQTQAFFAIGVPLVFLYFLGKAVWGAFVFHKLQREENPDFKSASKWTYIIAIPSVLVMAFILVTALMVTTGLMRSPRVQTGTELEDREIAELEDHGIIFNEDTIRFFFSPGLFSILDSGHVLTQDRVISYYADPSEGQQVYELPLIDISDVVLESKGNDFTASVHRVFTNDPERWLLLILSPQFNGDRKFVDAMRDSVARLEVSQLGSVHLGMSPAEVEQAKGQATSVVRDVSTPRMGWIYGESPNPDDGLLWVLYSGKSANELTVDLICKHGDPENPLAIGRFGTEAEVVEKFGQPTHLNISETGLSKIISYEAKKIAYEITNGRVNQVCVTESGEVSYQDELFQAMKKSAGQEW